MRGVVAVLVCAAALLAGVPPAGARDAQRAPVGFVALDAVAPGVLTDLRYHGSHNFLGEPVVGYREPVCLLTREAAEAVARVQRAALRRGYSLQVYDCYRPRRAVERFVAWAGDARDTRTKAEFYPRVPKERLLAEGYIAERSAHSRGSTVDVTLVRLPVRPTRAYVPGEPPVPCYAPRAARYPDASVDMGTGYDCFDRLAHTLSPHVTPAQRAHRLLLRRLMVLAGFADLPQEWWHFTYRAEPYPDRSFDFPVARGSLPASGPSRPPSRAA
ncbi:MULTISPECIES: M15 family metallopeptidase [Streptomyces]|uniref:M15 family metallopeptidase n=1 Tax=Streptomyces TaxID=1883 RepID=UPI002249317C|nr:M15 family metallopeptidase [Streptomyces sp. JHD 1]MCX2968537.1 M15 family metallopeptidase [Streptomyces sp. JHD 1]